MSLTRAHVWVAGRVQGVWFRQSCADEARAAGVTGWVRNLGDGRVEAVFEGPPAGVDRMISWCRQGPPRAVVEDVAVDRSEGPEGLACFKVL